MKMVLFLICALFSFVGVNHAQAGLAVKNRQVASQGKSTFTDTIKKIRDDDEGTVILFNANAGSYYLRRDVADFDAMKKKLNDAFKANKPVSVTFDSTQLNILEVK
ncbi:hypothetical protein AZI86_04380 [Bdellovibrio bacteriovorus]|uniref:Uncharacterized protein n=1 Tax=Bdellovibrio bacteriovorus TaxID=959 RepID=A0A150WPS2_BDEBC|nr:hypothetical protein [Bdellovibrio bacteriovorus]KYG66299.1 hypothetical protein AZI86_04380 [Bdellovibrio bacteriovorus]